MRTLEMSSNDNNKWRLVLTGLRPDNVQEIYEREIGRWQVFHSDKRILDGSEISTDEFALMFVSGKVEGIENRRFEVSGTSEGFPLEEKIFILEQLNKYRYIRKDTEGSVLNRHVFQKCELYIQFLEERLKIIQPGKAPEKKAPAKSISFESCTQAVLYHKILQEADDVKEISHFQNVTQETKDLVDIYVKPDGGKWSAKSFYKAYFRVKNDKRYSSADYDYVNRIIQKRFPKENFPTVWERLKKHNKKDFF